MLWRVGGKASTSGQHIPRGEAVEFVDILTDPPELALQVCFPAEKLHVNFSPLD
jgi:hypothetical protein